MFIFSNREGRGETVWRSGTIGVIQTLDDVDDVHPAARPQDGVYAGDTFGNLSAVTLGQAAGGNEYLAALLFSRQFAQHLVRFFYSWGNKPARVDDNDARFEGVGNRDITGSG